MRNRRRTEPPPSRPGRRAFPQPWDREFTQEPGRGGDGDEGLVRLQKVLAQAGIASRREAEELIAEGRVTVNRRTVDVPGTRIDPDRDAVEVDGVPLARRGKKRSYLVYKPVNVLCTRSDPQGRTNLYDILPGEVADGLHSVGRLDFDAEGLIILTNDGELTQAVTHPAGHIPKTYLVKVKGRPSGRELALLRKGIRLEDGVTAPAEVHREKEAPQNTWIRIVLREGRKNQVKRMFSAVGHPVLKLVRIQIGPITLSSRMRPGTFRRLTSGELAALTREKRLVKV